jgi:AcrR family transcriptional regulator
MANHELNTESKILETAIHAFLLYGFHGTTLHIIADKAGVNAAAIHYYFRSKERLYRNVTEKIFYIFLHKSQVAISDKKFEEIRWFFFTELYNNKELFEKTLKEIYPEDWNSVLYEIKNWIDNSSSQLISH